MPWAARIAKHGAEKLAKGDPHFANAVNTYKGRLTNEPVAQAHDLKFEALAL